MMAYGTGSSSASRSVSQSYARVGKFALIQHQRYALAKQFKRANRKLKTLRTYLGRVIRDIGRNAIILPALPVRSGFPHPRCAVARARS